ncbi:hypothetical protein CYMTET_23417, partial [Cymbomonas tetramitiformis]
MYVIWGLGLLFYIRSVSAESSSCSFAQTDFACSRRSQSECAAGDCIWRAGDASCALSEELQAEFMDVLSASTRNAKDAMVNCLVLSREECTGKCIWEGSLCSATDGALAEAKGADGLELVPIVDTDLECSNRRYAECTFTTEEFPEEGLCDWTNGECELNSTYAVNSLSTSCGGGTWAAAATPDELGDATGDANIETILVIANMTFAESTADSALLPRVGRLLEVLGMCHADGTRRGSCRLKDSESFKPRIQLVVVTVRLRFQLVADGS